MPVRIAKEDAQSTAGPGHAALDDNVQFSKAREPGIENIEFNTEADVRRTLAIVRRNGAAGQFSGLRRGTPHKEQQDAVAAGVQRAEAFIRREHFVAQQRAIEVHRPREIIDVEARFANGRRGQRRFLFHTARAYQPTGANKSGG